MYIFIRLMDGWMDDFSNWIKFQLKIYIFCDVFWCFVYPPVFVCVSLENEIKNTFSLAFPFSFCQLYFTSTFLAITVWCLQNAARNNEFNWIQFISLWKRQNWMNARGKTETFTHFSAAFLFHFWTTPHTQKKAIICQQPTRKKIWVHFRHSISASKSTWIIRIIPWRRLQCLVCICFVCSRMEKITSLISKVSREWKEKKWKKNWTKIFSI